MTANRFDGRTRNFAASAEFTLVHIREFGDFTSAMNLSRDCALMLYRRNSSPKDYECYRVRCLRIMSHYF
jgi:hypothetical protein